jgi:hypothetical protein
MLRPSGTRASEEVILPLRAPGGRVAPVTHARSTLIAGSVLGLRERGYLDRYLTHLPDPLHDTILHSVAGSWLPLGVAAAHYRATEALGLSSQEQFEMGSAAAERIQNTVLGTLVRVAKGAGVTPWVGLEYFQRLWDRLLQGGSGAVYALGPKEARVEAHGVGMLAEIPYVRNAWRGMFAGSGSLFCSKIYVTEIRSLTTATTLGFRVAWA